jgi:uncharacterized protein
MKPGEHPDFFRFAPPPGTSRESTIVLDREGFFWHDGARVDHPALAEALHRWISKHPDDGRLILTNGYDWCYFRAESTPFIVKTIRTDDDGSHADLVLSDATTEALEPQNLSMDDEGVVFARVKRGAFEARFSRHAQASLGPLLVSADPPIVKVGEHQAEVQVRNAQ